MFVLSDLRGSNPRVKEMHLLSHFTGEALASRAVKAPPLEVRVLLSVIVVCVYVCMLKYPFRRTDYSKFRADISAKRSPLFRTQFSSHALSPLPCSSTASGMHPC